MAMSARVTNANGRIVAEKRNGQRRYHQHDALGSTIALINDAGTVTNTFDYWPYGEIRTPVFGLPTPFLYCGQWGYYTDTTGRIYVRARTYRPILTRWLTVDPQWPWESAYGYCLGSPISFVDYRGAAACNSQCCDKEYIKTALEARGSHCDNGATHGGWTPCKTGTWKTQCRDRLRTGEGLPDCEKVRGWIRDRLGWCVFFGGGGEYSETDPWAGTILCCEEETGKHRYCGAYCCEKNMSADPCWNFCLARHEEYHGKECKSFAVGTNQMFNENCAYMVQVKCLYALFEKRCSLSWSEFPDFQKCKETLRGCLS